MDRIGNWLTVTIDISVSVTDSLAVNLGGCFKELMILAAASALTSGKISPEVSKDGTNFYPVYVTDPASGNDNILIQTTANTGAFVWIVPIGGAEWIKIISDTTQTSSDKTLYVRGIGKLE